MWLYFIFFFSIFNRREGKIPRLAILFLAHSQTLFAIFRDPRAGSAETLGEAGSLNVSAHESVRVDLDGAAAVCPAGVGACILPCALVDTAHRALEGFVLLLGKGRDVGRSRCAILIQDEHQLLALVPLTRRETLLTEIGNAWTSQCESRREAGAEERSGEHVVGLELDGAAQILLTGIDALVHAVRIGPGNQDPRLI